LKKVFVASTIHTDKSLRAEVFQALREWGFEPILSDFSESFQVPLGTDSYSACVKKVEDADLLLLIITKRYGGLVPEEIIENLKPQKKFLEEEWNKDETDADKRVSITELEYVTAILQKIPRINFCDEEVWIMRDLWDENRNNAQFKWPKHFSDGPSVMRFLDKVRKVSAGTKDNWIHRYHNSTDFKTKLKSQLCKVPSTVINGTGSKVAVFGPLTPQENPDFIGRTEALADLRERLISGQIGAWKQVITGTSGVGKTQLAVKYVYSYQNEYAVIWWMRAEEPGTLADDYAELAYAIGSKALDLSQDQMTKQTVRMMAVRCWLENESNWLLVFDNARNPKDIVGYLPHQERGHVLITSRNPSWHNTAEVSDINVFDRHESITILTRLTGEMDINETSALAEELGDLPLAIVSAGSYCAARYKTISEYRELFHKYQTELLARGEPSADYKQSVAVTLDIALDSARSDCPGAADILNLIAFLSPDEIPRSLLMRWMQLPDSVSKHFENELDFDDAIATLLQSSLMTVHGDSIAVHRLVQMRTRDRLKEEGAIWAGEAIMMVADAFVFEEKDIATWSLSARLLPHGLAAAYHAEKYRVAAKWTAYFLNDAGRYLKNYAQFREAKSVFERAVAIKENIFGIGNPKTAGSIGNLALVLRDLGEYDDAKIRFEQVLDIFESNCDPNDLNIAFTLNNLGLVLMDLNDPAAARRRFERALAIKKSHYKTADHADVVDTEVSLAIALRNLGERHQAKQLLEHALRILEASYGPRHPLVADALTNLGSLRVELYDLESANDLDRSKEMLERALKIDEDTYGPVHPKVAQDLDNLAAVSKRLGEVDEAKKLRERATKIRDSLD
jgi:tetratricopeptide (TPR) repeat protein